MSDATILLVDDDDIFLSVLSRAMEKRAYRVIAADNIATALQLSKTAEPDYAVIDLKIENESGLEIISPLLEINPDVRILILTGYSSIATAVAAIKQGAYDYACKPLDADEILRVLMEKPDQRQVPTVDEPVSVDRLQWEHIQRVLAENDGNISATARSLGMHRRTLQRKLQKRPVKR